MMLCGLLLLAIGIAGTASALVRSSPVGIAIAFLGLAGLGMGIVCPGLSVPSFSRKACSWVVVASPFLQRNSTRIIVGSQGIE